MYSTVVVHLLNNNFSISCSNLMAAISSSLPLDFTLSHFHIEVLELISANGCNPAERKCMQLTSIQARHVEALDTRYDVDSDGRWTSSRKDNHDPSTVAVSSDTNIRHWCCLTHWIRWNPRVQHELRKYNHTHFLLTHNRFRGTFVYLSMHGAQPEWYWG